MVTSKPSPATTEKDAVLTHQTMEARRRLRLHMSVFVGPRVSYYVAPWSKDLEATLCRLVHGKGDGDGKKQRNC